MFALPGIEYFAFFMFAAPGLACVPMRNRNHAVGGNVAAPSYHKHIACYQKGGVDRAFFIAEQDIVLDRLLGKGGGLERTSMLSMPLTRLFNPRRSRGQARLTMRKRLKTCGKKGRIAKGKSSAGRPFFPVLGKLGLRCLDKWT